MKHAAALKNRPEWGGPVVELACAEEDTGRVVSLARIAPNEGCNLFSFAVDGRDYLWADAAPADVNGFLGVPILHPTPNRVKNAAFEFEGRRFAFPPNSGAHFIHGLVRREPWNFSSACTDGQGAYFDASISFEPGNERHRLFPVRHTVSLRIHLMPNAVKLTFRISNEDERHPLPFGLAIHPYFPVIGAREKIRLQVPATHWMEADECLPTGRLVDLSVADADLRSPAPLSALNLDDVFWGMAPERPAAIYYDEIGKVLALRASDFFTHAVVYTPPGQPFFCIENQSCSTDAHNLHARGLEKESHLAALAPGASLEAWIEMRIEDQRR